MMNPTISPPLYSTSSSKKEAAVRAPITLGAVLSLRRERRQAGGAGGLLGIEIDHEIRSLTLLLAQSLVVEHLKYGASPFDLVARDREQDPRASRAGAARGLDRRRGEIVALTEFLQLSDLVEVALEERDQRAFLHRVQSVEPIQAAVNSVVID